GQALAEEAERVRGADVRARVRDRGRPPELAAGPGGGVQALPDAGGGSEPGGPDAPAVWEGDPEGPAGGLRGFGGLGVGVVEGAAGPGVQAGVRFAGDRYHWLAGSTTLLVYIDPLRLLVFQQAARARCGKTARWCSTTSLTCRRDE